MCQDHCLHKTATLWQKLPLEGLMHHQMLTFQKYQEPSIDTLKCLANNNPKDSPNTQYGIMPSNYYQEHQHHYWEGFCVFPKTKSKKYQRSWPNIYQEEPFDQASDHMPRMSSLSKRKMENYALYKTIVLLINGRRRTAMYPH